MSSLWIETTKEDLKTEILNGNIETEICIIGAGIFGLTTAYYLGQCGKKVTVIEKERIGEKVSGNTTGKITSQHGLFYNYLVSNYGIQYAQKYLKANEEAIKNIKEIIDNEKIECEYEEKDSYVYAQKEDEVLEIEKEIEAVEKAGIKAEFIKKINDFPIDIKGAIKFKGQAQFHPRKYMIGLCKTILKQNKIYEKTTALEIEKNNDEYIIYTDRGNIKSKYIVLATHFPIINTPGFYFAKMYQSTSYAIAIETEKKLFDGMIISAKEPIYSFRTSFYNGKKVLLICGTEHKTGEAIATEKKYKELEDIAKKYYPDCKIIFKWNTRDCISLDKIPYIGEFSNLMNNVYIGTGFKKWGMTSSNVAAKIITDKILKNENEYEEIFNSRRMNLIKNRAEVKNMVINTANSLVFNKFRIEPFNINQIEKNNGAIIEINTELVGVYKDINGEIYAVKPICSHLGCLLNWNNTDKTWDCPCHGSRFDFTGKNIYEPAIKGLEQIKI